MSLATLVSSIGVSTTALLVAWFLTALRCIHVMSCNAIDERSRVGTKKVYSPLGNMIFAFACGSVCHVCSFLRQPTTGPIVNRGLVKPLKECVRTIAELQPEPLLRPQECFLLSHKPYRPHRRHLYINKQISSQQQKERESAHNPKLSLRLRGF